MNIFDYLISIFFPQPIEVAITNISTPSLAPLEPLKKEGTMDLSVLDPKDIAKVKLLYPRIQENAYKFLLDVRNAGFNGGIFMSYRTFAEQDALYAQGRTKPGQIVTNAKGGWSYHNYGIAFDFVFKTAQGNWTWNSTQWEAVAKLGIKNGWEWGGSWMTFPDRPHMQMVFNQQEITLLKLYQKKNSLADVWQYLDNLPT